MSASGQFLRHLNWLLNPKHGLDTSQVYDLIDTGSLTSDGLYLNLGYWRQENTIDGASRALAMLVAERGQMGPKDTVLDCGFGFADQDILWANNPAPAQIIGVNITASQVQRAQERVAEAGLEHRIDLRQGSATALPLDSESVDLVVALESAFHFSTREDFFREASRVLRPNGRLVTADIVPTDPQESLINRLRQRVSWYLVASRFNIPRDNVYGIGPYTEKLGNAGFKNIAVESIRDDVYTPLHRFLRSNPQHLAKQHALARWLAKATLRRKSAKVYAGLDYIIATAVKAPVNPNQVVGQQVSVA